MSNQEATRVFVYGTLKKSHPNHGALRDQKFLGRTYLEGSFRMVDASGWFPGLVDVQKEKNKVFGEVYEINQETLRTLDIIEGHPNFYTRRKMNTEYKNAWVYFLPQHYDNTASYPAIDGGVWQPSADEVDYMLQVEGSVDEEA